ncbi:MAG: hypothetical protein KJP07_02540 [Desulfatitalea sp.]|nr:hypothetical protein [Desulfatitalea sp.]
MSKKAILTVLVVCLLFGNAFAEVVFTQKIEKSAAGTRIYKMEMTRLDERARMRRLMETLELAGVQIPREHKRVETQRFVGLSSDSVEGIINAHGSEMMFTDLKGLKLVEKTGDLPKDEEAVKIARNFLESAKLVNLRRQELVVGHIGGLMQSLASPRTNYGLEKKAVAVHFNRKLDGLAVMNKGSHITVMIGDTYSPINLYYSWREIGKAVRDVSKLDVLSPKQIKKRIVEDISEIYNMDQKIIIDKIYLVYYDRGEEYIQPAFCYEGRAEGKTEVPQPVLGYVPGLIDPPEPVHHPAYLDDLAIPGKP